MNLKPTTWKVAVSAVIASISGYLSLDRYILSVKATGGLLPDGSVTPPDIVYGSYNWHQSVTIAIITFVVVYIIWSLFQKNKIPDYSGLA